MSRIREHAKGHWPRIIAHWLGDQAADTRKHGPCPGTGDGTDRYRFSDVYGGGQYFCSCSDGSKDGIQLLECALGTDFKGACQAVEAVIGPAPKDDEAAERKPTLAEQIRGRTERTSRSRYLAGRGLEVAPALEWIRSLPYYDGDGNKVGDWPAMLAPIMRGDQWLTYHATYLEAGDKAPVTPARKILPANQPLRGAACPLYPLGRSYREGTGACRTLGIAEGTETAIAAKMLDGIATHAALNTSLLKHWQPPAGVDSVVIYGDRDANYAGQAAAYALAHSLDGKGYGVTVRFPSQVGDFNDELLAWAHAS